MKNNLSENGRNLTAGVDLWNLRRKGTQNYSEIDSVSEISEVLRIPSHSLSLSAFQLVDFAQNPNLMRPLWRVIQEDGSKVLPSYDSDAEDVSL